MQRKSNEHFNIWRIIFWCAVVIIIVFVAYNMTNIEEEVIIDEYQDVLDNSKMYVDYRITPVNIFTEYRLAELYNISVEDLAKDLNGTNAIHLYRYIGRHFTFGEPRHPIEVLEEESGDELGLHSLLTSMFLSLDKNANAYLLLTKYNGQNHSAVLLKLNETTYYFDLTINNTNISYDAAVNFLEVGQQLNLQDFEIRYAIGAKYRTSTANVEIFNKNIEFYIWLSDLYKRG